MAWQVPQSQTVLGYPVLLLETDSAFIASGVTVCSTAADTIFGFGSFHQVIVYGTVVGTGLAGVLLGDNAALDSNNTLTVKAGGHIQGLNSTSAVVMRGFQSTVVNEGLILNEGNRAIFINSVNSATSSTISNSGTIESRFDAIVVEGTEALTLTNSGRIAGGSSAFADSAADAARKDTITNTGTMIGFVSLGNGNDVYNGATGRLTGTILGGDGNDTITTGIDNDTIDGGDGNDVIAGGAGADSLRGGIGNDTYVLANDITDTITDTGGLDTITSTISRTLVNPSIENLTLVGTANISGVGNAAVNVIVGNGGINGLNGGANNDVLLGGLGKDTLIGGLGDDRFWFTSTAHSLVANPDVITDFDDLGNDRIDVSALFGPAMIYRHNLAFTAAGQVRINDIAGADVLVEVNVGGTLAPDLAIRLTATALASMTATDFVL